MNINYITTNYLDIVLTYIIREDFLLKKHQETIHNVLIESTFRTLNPTTIKHYI